MPAVQPASCGRSPGAGNSTARAAAHQATGISASSASARPTRRSSPTSCAARSQLQAAADQFLPDPDQVPRRDPPALRRHARARIPDEGCLLLPRRPGLPGKDLLRSCTRPTAASSAAAGSTSARCRPTPAASAATVARVPCARRLRRRCHRLLRPTATMPPTSSWPRPWRRRDAARRPPRAAHRRHAGGKDHRRCLVEQFGQPIEQHRQDAGGCAADPRPGGLVALVLRGDHELNRVKAEKHPARWQPAAHGHGGRDPRRLRRRLRLPGPWDSA
jgi:hypothetical protein